MIDEIVMLLVSDADEAKALTGQIMGHKNLLSRSELDESVTNAIEIRQVQQAEFISLQEMKSGRQVRAKQRASRLVIPTRRPFSFTRVCGAVYIAGDADETSEAAGHHDEVQ